MERKKMSFFIAMVISLILITAGCGTSSTGGTSNGNTGGAAGGASSSNNSGGSGNSNNESVPETITLSFASASPATAPYTVGFMEPFMNRVTELTNGQVQFEFFPGEQLGVAKDLLDLTANGVADIGYYGASFYPSKMPIGSALGPLPGLHSNAYEQTMAFHELTQTSPMLETDFLAHGVRPIMSSGIPPYEFYTKGDAIRVPADLKGKKVRSTGGAGAAALEFMGAIPVSVNTPEMYEAFDQGIIDVIYQFPRTMQSYGLQELVKYGTVGASFGSSVVGFVINEDVYQGLPQNVKDAIHQAAEETMEEYSSSSDKESDEVLQSWISELGIEIVELTEEEKLQWRNTADEFNKSYIETLKDKDVILEVLEKYKELLEKY